MKKIFYLLCSLSLMIFALSLMAQGALTTPIAVQTETFASGVVTVNSTAHGLVANQGFCKAGDGTAANNVCGTVVTATTNSFTFNLATGAACASSCGTVAPMKRFLIGAVTPFGQQGIILITVCIWTTTIVPVAKAGAVSACPNAISTENGAIAAGTTVETVFTLMFPNGFTKANVQTFLQQLQVSMQAELVGGVQPGALLGVACDGAATCN